MTDRLFATISQMIDVWRAKVRSNQLLVIGAIGLCALAVLIVLISTSFGAGVGTDSVVYLAAARNLLAGDGISWIGPQGDVRPIVIFAPFYPVVLAGLSLLTGLDVWVAARWLLAIVFCVNVVLLILLIYQYSKQTTLALAAGVLFIFSRPMITNHTGVASEPLFLTFLLASLLMLSLYSRSRRNSNLIVSALLMGLAFLTRYAGVYFIAGGALLILLYTNEIWRLRLRDSLIWLGTNGVIALVWVWRNREVAGSGTARSWMPALPPNELIENILSDMVFWFLPEMGLLWIRVTIVALLAAGIIVVRWLWLRNSNAMKEALERRGQGLRPSSLIIILGVYLVGLILTRSIFVPRIDIISRTLFPAHVLTMMLMCFLLADLIDLARVQSASPMILRALWTGTLVFILVYALRGLQLIQILQEDGQGYASERWSDSPLMNAMNLLPEDTPIYTNHVEAIYLFTGRHPYRLPYGCLPEDNLVEVYAQADCQDPAYLEWVQSMRHKLQEEQAVVVLFGRTYEQVYDPLIPELIEGLEPLSIQGDGVIYVQDVEEWPENPHW